MKTFLSIFSSEIYGGPHNELHKMAKYFQQEGLELVAVLPKENVFTRTKFEEVGIQTRITKYRRFKLSSLGIFKYLVFLPFSSSKLRHVIEEIQPDVLQFYNFSNLELPGIAKKLKIPTIWKIIDSRMPSFLGKKIVFVYKKRVTQILTTGESLGNIHYGLKSKDSWSYYYPFFDTSENPNVRTREETREILKIPSDTIAIGMLSNFNPQKRHSIAIDAFSEVFRNSDSYRLILRGSTSVNPVYFKKIKNNLIKKCFDIDTALDLEPEITPLEFMRALDIHLVISGKNSEGFPNTIVEAFSVGTIIVSSNSGSVSDILSNFENGILLSKNLTKFELIELFSLVKMGRINLQLLKAKKLAFNEFEFRAKQNISIHLETIKKALIMAKSDF